VTGATRQEVSSLGDRIQLVVGSTFEGVKHVTISTTTDQPTVTTGASNPCS
jgi:hypothetical protein